IPLNDEPIRVSNSSPYAEPGGIAWSGESYVAAYTTEQGKNTYTVPLTPAGEQIPPREKKLTDIEADSYAGPLVWIGDRYGVVWQDRRFENYEIFFTLLNDKGNKVIPDVRISNAAGFSIYPSIGWNGTQFVIVWQDERDQPQ